MTTTLFDAYPIALTKEDRTVALTLSYPGIENNPDTIQISLDHVRVIPDLRISFNFDFNSWLIETEQFGAEPEDRWVGRVWLPNLIVEEK